MFSDVPATIEAMAGAGCPFANTDYESFRRAMRIALGLPPDTTKNWASALRERHAWSKVAERIVRAIASVSRRIHTAMHNTSTSLKIALLGSRGIPARYGGFETFYEQLGVRLAARGHQVTVYNRAHFIRDVKCRYRGVRIVSLPSIATKHLDTITHTFLSSLDALFRGYDIVYYSIVGNSPLAWIPHVAGAKTLLNVDGEDWAREKWGRFARWYQKRCEWIAAHTADVLIADAHGVQLRYRDLYGKETIFVPYGANVAREDCRDALEKWGLEPDGYYLYVGRFVPENAIDLLLRSFSRVRTRRKLVVVGDAPYTDRYKAEVRALAAADERVVLTGYVFGDDYAQLSSHAYVYIQPSGVDGTRPALLDQMGFGNCVVVRNSTVNMEVIGDCGCFFDREDLERSLSDVLQGLEDHPDRVTSFRTRVRSRIERYYNWEWVTDFYEDLFQRMLERCPTQSYDDFLSAAQHQELSATAESRSRAPVPPRVNVLGVGIHALDQAGATRRIVDAASAGRVGYVTCTSVHGVIESQRDEVLRRIHNESLLTVPDGMPTVWMGHEQGFVPMGRVYGPELMRRVIAATAGGADGVKDGVRRSEFGGEEQTASGDQRPEAGIGGDGQACGSRPPTSDRRTPGAKRADLRPPTSDLRSHTPLAHFFYGSTDTVLEKLTANLRARYPGLAVAGSYSPPFRPLAEEEWPGVIDRIVDSGAAFVWVGLSTPKQERFMAEFVRRLRRRADLAGARRPENGRRPEIGGRSSEIEPTATGARKELTDRSHENGLPSKDEADSAGPLTSELRTPTHEPRHGLVLIGVGAAFDLHAGLRKDSPDWVKRAGLQWFHRLCQEPKRLWRRYLHIVPAFLWLSALQVLGIKKYDLGPDAEG